MFCSDCIGLIRLFQDAQIHKRLPGVFAYRDASACQRDALGILQILKSGYLGSTVLPGHKHHLVIHHICAGSFPDQPILFQLVHLLLGSRKENITFIPFLDLGQQGAGTIRIEGNLHIRIVFIILFRDFRHDGIQACRDKHLDLRLICVILLGFLRGLLVLAIRLLCLAASATCKS